MNAGHSQLKEEQKEKPNHGTIFSVPHDVDID